MMNKAKVMGVLRQVEWATLPIGWGGRGYQSFCPCCRKWKGDSHANDCKLAALLDEGREEKQAELTDLVTALENITDFLEGDGQWVEARMYIEQARAAIANAKRKFQGGQQVLEECVPGYQRPVREGGWLKEHDELTYPIMICSVCKKLDGLCECEGEPIRWRIFQPEYYQSILRTCGRGQSKNGQR